MNLLNCKPQINGVTVRTGWLPPVPDLRDYSSDQDEILQITRRSKQPATRNTQPATLSEPQKSPSPVTDLREWCSDVEDQGSIGSCTAHAAASIVEYYERRAFGKHLEASRLFLYKTTRNLMQVTGDKGAWIRCTMGALVLCGLPDEKYWPYDITKFDKEPPAFVYSLANNFKTVKYFRHDVKGRRQMAEGERKMAEGERKMAEGDRKKAKGERFAKTDLQPSAISHQPSASPSEEVLNSVKKYLVSGIPSMFGFYGFGSFDKCDTPGGIPYPAENEAAQWGHAVAAVGYDDNRKITNLVNNKTTKGALLIRNSWGRSWGDEGYGWLPYDYVLNGLAEDFWSLISMDWIDTGQFGV